MTENGRLVGIDLGTTHSLVAVMHDGEPVVLPNALGERLTPSAVSSDGETLLVGAPAKARAAKHPETTALSFKRDMGTDRRFPGVQDLRPEQLSALVLEQLAQDAESALGEAIRGVVVTVPAYFNDLQRNATREAARLAGLRVERLINEPTAAAIAYGLHQRHRELRAVVLDLGGGTFDVTVLEILEGVIEIQSSAGDTRLGGDDFTSVLVEWSDREMKKRYGVELPATGTARARTVEAAERAKITLSRHETARIALPQLDCGGQRIDVDLELRRDEIESHWESLLHRLEDPIRRALRDARVTIQDIDELLLVGGATRMPCFVHRAAQIFQRMPSRDLPADEAVALGAALQAGLHGGSKELEDVVVTDVAPFTLGVRAAEQLGGKLLTDLFTPILERGTVLPASRVERFSTIHDWQTHVDVEVYQGEHSQCRDNRHIGTLAVSGLPPSPAGQEMIDIRFTYDLNGLLEVEAIIVRTQVCKTLLLEDNPGRLSPEEIAAMQRKMEELKVHPRDTLPNTTALARAEALYVESTGTNRTLVGDAIRHFQAALERQDPELIKSTREGLLALVERMRSSG